MSLHAAAITFPLIGTTSSTPFKTVADSGTVYESKTVGLLPHKGMLCISKIFGLVSSVDVTLNVMCSDRSITPSRSHALHCWEAHQAPNIYKYKYTHIFPPTAAEPTIRMSQPTRQVQTEWQLSLTENDKRTIKLSSKTKKEERRSVTDYWPADSTEAVEFKAASWDWGFSSNAKM